jgi:hypothetical protein
MADPEVVARAKRALADAERRRSGRQANARSGIRFADVLDAEERLDQALDELREYSNGDDSMFETLDREGRKGLVINEIRLETLRHLQDRVAARQLELQTTKRAWLGIPEGVS